MLIRQDPILNAHLRRRIFLFPLISLPSFQISSTKIDYYTKVYGEKYLSDLTDDEIKDFDRLY